MILIFFNVSLSYSTKDNSFRRIRRIFIYREYRVTENGLVVIPGGEKINFPFPVFGTDQHQGVYFWLKEKIVQKEIERGLVLINLDYHSDYDTSQDSTLSDATWLIFARREGLIGDIYWVRPKWGEYNPVPGSEVEDPFALRTQELQTLPPGDKLGGVIFTIDFDYFSLKSASPSSNNKDQTQHRPTDEELEKIVQEIIKVIKDKKIIIKALNFTFSPVYVWSEDINRIKEKLLSAFQILYTP
ncbi:MAG: hypothetical protein ACK4NT_05410 [Candidatus Omnitrophota bacterium]